MTHLHWPRLLSDGWVFADNDNGNGYGDGDGYGYGDGYGDGSGYGDG